MNTRFLETLVTLARLGSFRATAAQLHTTQAAVSQRIAALERDLDVQLINRSTRDFRLTLAGERVIKQAERILAVERELRLVASPNAPPAGRVRIGVIESVVHTWLTAFIRELAQRFPGIQPDLTVDTSRNLRAQFSQYRHDLIVQNNPIEEAAGDEVLTVTPLCRYPLRWIGRPKLLPRRRVTRDDLLGLPLLTFSRNSNQHRDLCALFEDRESELHINTFPSVAAILRLVMESFGLAAIPPLFVKAELERGALVIFDGPHLPPISLSVARLQTAPEEVVAVSDVVCGTVRSYCKKTGAPWVKMLPVRKRR